MYPVGWPLWKLLVRLGVPAIVRIEVVYDAEAEVYVATSPNLDGLIAEADSKAALMDAVHNCIDLLMEEKLPVPPEHRPLAAWSGELLAA